MIIFLIICINILDLIYCFFFWSFCVGIELMCILFFLEIFLWSEIYVKIILFNLVKFFKFSVFKVEKLVFVRNLVYKKVWFM